MSETVKSEFAISKMRFKERVMKKFTWVSISIFFSDGQVFDIFKFDLLKSDICQGMDYFFDTTEPITGFPREKIMRENFDGNFEFTLSRFLVKLFYPIIVSPFEYLVYLH